jgi:hypothetical protein
MRGDRGGMDCGAIYCSGVELNAWFVVCLMRGGRLV